MNNKLKGYILATRPWSFTMTAISVALGALLGLSAGSFQWYLFLLTLVAMIVTHGATNVINDYFDTRHGVDRPESPTAQYRQHPILTGTFEPREILTASIVLYVFALAIGIVLASMRGWILLGFAAIGGLASVFYSAGPIKYKHRALGEVAVFLMWGPLMVLGSFFIQTGQFAGWGGVLLASIPQGLWVALVIFANNLKDIGYDEDTGVHTIPNIMGLGAAKTAFIMAVVAIYALLAVLVALGVMPLWTLAVVLSIPLSIKLIRSVTRAEQVPADADPQTAQAGMVFGLMLVAGVLLQYIVPV